jgi:uncharacterized protein YjiS (DUF1127 family)
METSMSLPLPRFLQTMITHGIARDRRRRARLELARLDPRLLRDIGITAADRDAEIRRLDY